ncbi:MAG: polymer-forming cytoskeletal protein [Anaerolineae bacterium]|nr:polymer-forming cytoskeletal protein [Anaerolineae bacterium]MDW8098279.1 polymer-forming cytoskeletal protein [Anaerolineae bacterium]
MLNRERRPEPDAIEVVLGPRASFNGHLRCDGSVRIDGVVEGGVIETPANVIITATGRVMADIYARIVSISGAVKGTITADRVELLDGGRIWGTVRVASFLLDEGGFFSGELIMQGEPPEEPFIIPQPAEDMAIPVFEGERSY